MTIQLTFYGTVLGFALGIVLALVRLSKNPFLQTVAWTYIWAFRSIPLIVQLLFWFNIAYLYQPSSSACRSVRPSCTFDDNDRDQRDDGGGDRLALHQAAYRRRSSGPASYRSMRGSWKPLRRWESRNVGSSSGSSCHRPCARSCRTQRTR